MTRDRVALRDFYARVFLGQDDRIPILVGVPCPGQPKREALWREPAGAVAQAARAAQPRLDVDDDWIPSVNLGYWQNVLIPRLYGAESVAPPGSEPICRPRFRAADEAAAAGVPEFVGAPVDEMLAMLRAARGALPPGWALSFPVSSSPFDLAQLLLGQEFLLAVHEAPEDLLRFLLNLAEAVCAAARLAKRELGLGPREYITNRGCFFPGLRQPCDAVVNLSPAHLRRLALPVFERLGREFGALCIHYCTTPARAEHVLPVLTESPWVRAVDNWQGPEAFIGDAAPARMQDRVALICDVDLTSPEKMDAFLARPPVRDVPRRGGRGLVVSSHAPDATAARRLVQEWRKRQPGG